MADQNTCELVDIASFGSHGFCAGYVLMRHNFESLANAGCQEARKDWLKRIGPINEFGGCNPVNGNFAALVLPLCRIDRLGLVAYVLEYAFLHDNVVEEVATPLSTDDDEFSFGKAETGHGSVEIGRRQLQAKMMLSLSTVDSECTRRVKDAWKTMLSTTLREKSLDFNDLEHYLDFRIIDTGAPFVEALMLFGMAMTLTTEEDAQLANVVRPCFAALALANDYFSFERERREAEQLGSCKPPNAVWLYMQWQGVDAPTAKALVKKATNGYERQFLHRCNEYRTMHAPISEKVDRYLRALSYQVSGNVVWSLNCPRYHVGYRYDPNEGVEDIMTAKIRNLPHQVANNSSTAAVLPTTCYSVNGNVSYGTCSSESGSSANSLSESMTRSPSSASSSPPSRDFGIKALTEHPNESLLGPKHVMAPFDYTCNLPAKGVRDSFIDALNVWTELPDTTVVKLKDVVARLHTASLMFDDIEDGSELRRGQPAAYTIFGTAQTVNAASFSMIEALDNVLKLELPGAIETTLEHLRHLHVGQSYDLYWTRHGLCPSEQDYLDMASKKTGGLFHLVARLMCSKSSSQLGDIISELATLVGLYFQIRDDYYNLMSDEYADSKGFCDDLDEGKFSFPLVHHFDTNEHPLLREVLARDRRQAALSSKLKELVIGLLKSSGSMSYTEDVLKRLERQISQCVERAETLSHKENWLIKLLFQQLAV